MVEQEFTAVLASAAEGDEFAFARIVDADHDDMRRVCAFITRDPDLAEDAVQTAWSIAWRKLGSVREPSKLRPWLMRVGQGVAVGQGQGEGFGCRLLLRERRHDRQGGLRQVEGLDPSV